MKKNSYIKIIAIILALLICLSACVQSENNIIDNEEPLSSMPETSASEISEASEPEPEPEPVIMPRVELSSTEVERGSYIMIRIYDTPAETLDYTDFLGYERSLITYGGSLFGFIPVKVACYSGDYPMEIDIPTLDGEVFRYTASIKILDKKFDYQYLEVDEKTLEETLENEAANNEFTNKTASLKKVFTAEKLWNGDFVEPLADYPYKQTTTFGTYRTFSNGDTEYHNAVDMAAKGGTPVYATNSGKIIFAEYLQLTGNTVVIDHGLGVLSWHYHMKSISVSKGDTVEKGDRIGSVGTTGLSTGNHLHFGMTIGGIMTDPLAIVGTEPKIDFAEAEK